MGMGPICAASLAEEEISEGVVAELPFDGFDVILERKDGKIRTNVPSRLETPFPHGSGVGVFGSCAGGSRAQYFTSLRSEPGQGVRVSQ
jgi:hypothetical protein